MLSFAALADPTRRRIVELLARGERPAGEIVQEFAISASAISQHLKILRAARLTAVRVEGQRRIHSLDRTGLVEIESWLSRMDKFWSGHLDALERQLAADNSLSKKLKSEHPHR